jgi:hypothetical protein
MTQENTTKTGSLIEIEAGLYCKPDSWKYGTSLELNEGVDMLGLRSDAASQVQGRDVILPLSKIEITSRAIQWGGDGPKVRVRLTFWDEDEAPRTTGGWLYGQPRVGGVA